ncbi:MAG: Tad domain-containing protein [Bacteriovoracales bacterium]|nr:Tad domain-containing protein [Bacteriovoracales bacterium]
MDEGKSLSFNFEEGPKVKNIKKIKKMKGKKEPAIFMGVGQKGQLSVFLAVVLVIIVGLMAFVINIGIFVKAKINLQNAVDAAAYSGASVQARQLTNIAYMNWEMRNIYKEWMFKYYVLGQLSLKSTDAPGPGTGMDFRLPPFDPSSPSSSEYRKRGSLNVPSVCIDFVDTSPICNSYYIPGVPRYESFGVSGIDETMNDFIEHMNRQKSENCSFRSELNFLVATQWAYGLGKNPSVSFPPNTPRIGVEYPGAFPRAMEAALRVRNLERMVNEPPKEDVRVGNVGQWEGETPIHERTLKAFWAAYRNLAKSPDDEANNLKSTFSMTELAPTPKSFTDFKTDLGTYLMPNVGQRGGFTSGSKHYLDLQLHLLNYVTLFSLFLAKTVEEGWGTNVPDEGACVARKAAIPVPGYPLGFVKNPNVLTYYAVRGEARFTGLFSPFLPPIRMVAYGAAKPFGARIGPRLFQMDGTRSLRPRDSVSFNYMTGLKGLEANAYGIHPDDDRMLNSPIPAGQDFWVRGTGGETIGGIPQSTGPLGSGIRFGIPNFPFDFVPGSFPATGGIQATERYSSTGSGPTQETAGLYTPSQFFRFKPTGVLNLATSINADIVSRAMAHALRPTAYEAANYLIPSMEKHNSAQNVHSIGPIPSVGSDSADPTRPHAHLLYAPLFGEGLLFQGPDDIQAIVADYFDRNRGAVQLYQRALKQMAVGMAAHDVASGGNVYRDAGRIYHNIVDSVDTTDPNRLRAMIEDPGTDMDEENCLSIAGKFNHLYYGTVKDDSKCPIPLERAISDYWNDLLSNGATKRSFSHFFSTRYVRPEDVGGSGGPVGGNDLGIIKYMTGYLPGPRHGALETGVTDSTFNPVGGGGTPQSHRRNHYSVKFVSLQSLVKGKPTSYGGGNFSLFGEQLRDGPPTTPNGLNVDFRNPLRNTLELEDVRQ